jgi:hypothetical protein
MSAAQAVAVEPAPKPLKPEALDQFAAEYISLKTEIFERNLELLDALKEKSARVAFLAKLFTDACHAHGSPHEKKSKLLSGLDYELMTTESSSSSIDQAAVRILESKCERHGKTDLFEQLFESVSEYRARPGADAIARASRGLTGPLAVAYLKCAVTKTSPPRLTAVRPRQKATA